MRTGAESLSETSSVLAYVEHVLRWQDRVISEIAVEVDGVEYVPAWVVESEGIPAHRLLELYEEALLNA